MFRSEALPKALDAYRDRIRPQLMKKKDHNMLFVNLRGDP